MEVGNLLIYIDVEKLWQATNQGVGRSNRSGRTNKSMGYAEMLSPFSFSVAKNVVTFGSISGTTVGLRSTHCARCSLDRCAYFCTMSGVDHPPNSCSTCNGVPS